VKNKFPILAEHNLDLGKAKNVGDAGHRRGFLTQHKAKFDSHK